MHYKQNNKESKTYVQGLRQFGNTLPRGIKKILEKNGYNYSEIINKWDFLVGKNISDKTYPRSIKMVRGNSNGILVLAVKRGNEIDIEYSKKEIINKINSYFGYKLIGELRLHTFSSTDNKIKKNNKLIKSSKDFEKKISEIKNKNLKNSLSKLLKTLKND